MTNPHFVDCSRKPEIPPGYLIQAKNQPKAAFHGKLKFNSAAVELLYPDELMSDHYPKWGHEVKKKLTRKPVLTANVLDFLLTDLRRMPASWRKLPQISFFGTIFSFRHDPNIHGEPYRWMLEQETKLWVRCLTRGSDTFGRYYEWQDNFISLDHDNWGGIPVSIN